MSRTVVALRLARRELVRAPARTALVLAMVALPVAAVTAADVLLRTAVAPAAEAAPPLPAGAEALVREIPGTTDVVQDADGSGWTTSGSGAGSAGPRLRPEQLLAGLPAGSRLALVEQGIAAVALPDGPGRVRAVLADVADPLLAGRYAVDRGRLPAARGEVAVSPRLAEAGVGLGTTTRDDRGRPLSVVGVLTEQTDGDDLLALPGATSLAPAVGAEGRQWLVDSPRPVTWDDVQQLNAVGAVVTSRAVLEDPPAGAPSADGGSTWDATVFGLAAAMAVLEVVLLAGPAFAVGARRQRHALAQLAAAGGRPEDGRLVVLAGAGLLGVVAAGVGIAAGLGVASLLVSTVTSLGLRPAPDVPVLDLVVVFLIAVASALLAALAPAMSVARLDPVAVLTDRTRRDRPSRAPVLLGVVLLGVGVLGAVQAAWGGNEYSVALAAVPTVLGAVLLAPAALVAAARGARPLPFALRYAARDAARQRSRTAPAVGAITAVVAAAVALGVGGASDGEQSRVSDSRTEFAADVAVVTGELPSERIWDTLSAAVGRAAPGHDVRPLLGVQREATGQDVAMCLDGDAADGASCSPPLTSWGGSLSASVLVGTDALAVLGQLDSGQRAQAAEVLSKGGALVFTDRPALASRAAFTPLQGGTVEAPSLVVQVAGSGAPVRAVLSPSLADRLGLDVRTTGLAVFGPQDVATREAVSHALALRAPEASLATPVSPADRETGLALLLLGGVAGALVLGGVLTSTLLVLSDARPEFATLGTLGAAARTRRLIAAGYAATLGLVGALLGTAAGLVPGVAVAYPLTREGGPRRGLLPPFLDVPWLLVAVLVVVVPAVAAAVAALTARGTAPTVRRKALA